MAIITNPNTWLDQVDPEGYEEVYALYRCVADKENSGMWGCKRDGRDLLIELSPDNEGRGFGVDVKALRIMYREIQTLRQQLLGVTDDSEHQ